MDRKAKDVRRRGDEDAKLLPQRAAALISAVFIMLALLFSAAFPGDFRLLMADSMRSRPVVSVKSAATPAPTSDLSILIRLADVDKDVSPDVIIKLMNMTADSEGISLRGDEPKVLVYHTHNTEAYTETPESTYVSSGLWRTEDNERNVVAVGEELCRILNEEYGICAIHATEQHEKPLITTAYSRSLETVLSYKERYPSLEIFIDLHRDGVPETGYEDDYVTVDGKPCARMMFVVGTGKSGKNSQTDPGGTSAADEDMPDFESNYALAARLTETLLSYNDKFMRNVRVKSGKYNQQVSSKCLLVEVGHNANTLEQAMNSMEYLARAIAELEPDYNKKAPS